MEIVYGGRSTGKTHKMIMNAANHNGYIVCTTINEACRIADLARKLDVKINHPLCVEEFLKAEYSANGVRKLHIDNAEKILEHISKVQIESISMNKKDDSKNYELLYQKVIDGERVPCWVDYKFGKKYDKTARDICYCAKRKNGEINFSARGTGYGSTDDFIELEDVKKAFIKTCEYLNVEWVC